MASSHPKQQSLQTAFNPDSATNSRDYQRVFGWTKKIKRQKADDKSTCVVTPNGASNSLPDTPHILIELRGKNKMRFHGIERYIFAVEEGRGVRISVDLRGENPDQTEVRTRHYALPWTTADKAIEQLGRSLNECREAGWYYALQGRMLNARRLKGNLQELGHHSVMIESVTAQFPQSGPV